MVGRFMTGFQTGPAATFFAFGFAALVVFAYLLMGATWLIIKTDGDLQRKAVCWTRRVIWLMVAAALLTSLSAVFTDTRLYERMFSWPELTLLIVLPIASVVFTIFIHVLCGVLPLPHDRLNWLPFAIGVAIIALGFVGLTYSFYPEIVPGRLRIVDAAAAPESLMIILIGTAFVLPILIGYTVLAYWIFRGKAQDLTYE